jgi:hypothetical protein
MAFTGVTACLLAEPLNGPLHRRLRQFRYLHCRSDCYRLERPLAGWELHPLKIAAFSRRTSGSFRFVPPGIYWVNRYSVRHGATHQVYFGGAFHDPFPRHRRQNASPTS